MTPIIIPTLNRSEHFIRLIESLKKNTIAKNTDVIVGLDYPSKEEHYAGYNRILQYLNSDFNEFRTVVVFKRECNYGAERNLQSLIDYVISKYDRFIKTDDDVELSSNFLSYINQCLDKYEEDEDIVAVTGYSYPIEWKISKQASIFRGNFICPMWGTGFWSKKYRRIEEHIVKDSILQVNARNIILKGGLSRMTDVCRREFVDLCLSPDFNTTLASKMADVSLRMYMALYNKFIVMPTVSKVRNCGFDGTGEYCEKIEDSKLNGTSKTYSYNIQPIDEDNEFLLIPDTCNDIKANKILMNKFDSISFLSQIKTYLKLFLFLILGLSNYHRATLAIRRLKSTCKVKELLRLVQHA